MIHHWQEFVERIRWPVQTGAFLFDRSFMEYHRDRFADHSLVAIGDGRLLALLPANESGNTVISHGGLTYGGFVTDLRMRADLMLEVLDAVLDYTRRAGFARLLYKPVPHLLSPFARRGGRLCSVPRWRTASEDRRR